MKTLSERREQTTNIQGEYLSERPPFPKKVKIEVTNKCNLKCFYCQHTYDNADKNYIDRKFMFRLLDELKQNHVEEVGLFWMGEPLLNNELHEYIAHAKNIGIDYVFITSNGVLATPERMKRIIDSGLDSIKFSFNASTRRKYMKMHGVDAFDIVIENLKSTWKLRARRKKPSIYASSVFDPKNPKEFKKIQSIIAPFVDEHYPLQLYGSRKIKEVDGDYRIVDYPSEERRSLKSILPCWPMFKEPHISCDGHMSVCFCDRNERYFMGDLNKVSFIEAWHSDAFAALRRKHILKEIGGSPCEHCIAYSH